MTGITATDNSVAELVAEIIEELSDQAFADACGDTFRTVTKCSMQEIDQLWIRAFPDTFTGTADAWTIEVRLGVDTDYGRDDYSLRVTGRLTLGRTHLDSIVAI